MSWEPEGIARSAQAFLGACLVDIQNLVLGEHLQPEDMVVSSYGDLLREIRLMARRGMPVDTSTLIGRFNEEKIRQLGGRAAIFQLTEGRLLRSGEISKHVQALLDYGKKRHALRAVAAFEKDVQGDADFDQAREKFLRTLTQIPASSKATPSHAQLIQLSTVRAKDVSWLWEPLLPLGMLSMVSGDSDVGKSFMLQSVAAGLSIGQLPCGAGKCEPANTLHFTNENSPEYVLKPRFDKLGGDCSRYFHCGGSEWTDADGETHTGSITLADIPMLDDAIARSGAKLVLIDPIQSYIPTKTDAHRANDVRQLLDPLAKLAEKYACSIVLIRHLSKGTGGKAIYRGSMSVDFTAAVRSEMLVGYLQDDPSKRAVVHIVHNLGMAAPSVGFEIDRDGQFSWTGTSTITAAQLLADPSNETPEVAGKLKEAADWLRDFLTPDSQSQKDCERQAKDNGITFATLKRAKSLIGAKSHKQSFGGGFTWYLPKADQPGESLEPVEPLRSKANETDDLDRFNDLSHFDSPESSLISFEESHSLSHFDEEAQAIYEESQHHEPLR